MLLLFCISLILSFEKHVTRYHLLQILIYQIHWQFLTLVSFHIKFLWLVVLSLVNKISNPFYMHLHCLDGSKSSCQPLPSEIFSLTSIQSLALSEYLQNKSLVGSCLCCVCMCVKDWLNENFSHTSSMKMLFSLLVQLIMILLSCHQK